MLIQMIMWLLGSWAFAGSGAPIIVSRAYASAVPPGTTNSAVYFTVANTTAHDLTLTGASGRVARAFEFHQHVHSPDGMVMMVRIKDGILVKAHSSVKLAPGGMHLMLIGLKESFFKKRLFNIYLNVSNGSRVSVQVVTQAESSGLKAARLHWGPFGEAVASSIFEDALGSFCSGWVCSTE